jgi:transposase
LEGDWDVRRNVFWLNDEQWKRIEPHLPTDVWGVERVDDRRVIRGIVHVLRRWRIESAFNRLKDFRRWATTGWREITWPLSASPLLLYGWI